MSRDPGLINVLSLKQNNSLSDHRKVVRQSWTRIKSTLVTFFSFSSPTLRNILAPLLFLYNSYSEREWREFDEPRSRSNQCIEPEAKQLFVWSPQGGQAIVDQDQIDTRQFFFFFFITLRNILAPPLLLYNWYSAREQIEFDEPRSRSNQCIEPEAKQLFVWSPQGGQAIVDQDQIDTRQFFFFFFHNLAKHSCTTSIPLQFI